MTQDGYSLWPVTALCVQMHEPITSLANPAFVLFWVWPELRLIYQSRDVDITARAFAMMGPPGACFGGLECCGGCSG